MSEAYPFRTRRRTGSAHTSLTALRAGVALALGGLVLLALRDASRRGWVDAPPLAEAEPWAWLLLALAVVALLVWRLQRPHSVVSTPQAVMTPAALPAALEPSNTTLLAPHTLPVGALEQFPQTVMIPHEELVAYGLQTSLAPRVPVTGFNLALLQTLDWQRFEALCAALFSQAGFEARAHALGGSEGTDLWLFSRHKPGAPVSLVRVQQWPDPRRGAVVLAQMAGVMLQHKMARGNFVALSPLNTADVASAAKHGIRVIDGNELLRLIGQRSPAHQAALLNVATEGDYWRPTCPHCGFKMVEQPAVAAQGGDWWVCSKAPGCTQTLRRRP